MKAYPMRVGIYAVAALLTLISSSVAQRSRNAVKPLNGPVVIGRRTYFDFGPPFDFYEIFVVEPGNTGFAVERWRLTPPGHACIQPAQIEIASTSVNGTLSDILGGADPCGIPDKDIRRELKRCKHCLRFSGAEVMMQVRCGEQTRRIRMDVLDRDLFDRAAHPPEHTSWSMALLARLDRVLGDTVMEKHAFSVEQAPSDAARPDAHLKRLTALRRGDFDSLFPAGSQTPSALYEEAQKPPVRPSVELVETPPIDSVTLSLPTYPSLARAAHIQGRVTFSVLVDPTGSVSAVKIASGHPLLTGAVEAEARKWRFPADETSHAMNFAIEFKTNCPDQK